MAVTRHGWSSFCLRHLANGYELHPVFCRSIPQAMLLAEMLGRVTQQKLHAGVERCWVLGLSFTGHVSGTNRYPRRNEKKGAWSCEKMKTGKMVPKTLNRFTAGHLAGRSDAA